MRIFTFFSLLFAFGWSATFSLFAGFEGALTEEFFLKPGEELRHGFTLYNSADRSVCYRFRIVDYSCNQLGEHFFDEVGTRPLSNGSWLSLSAYQVELAPGERRQIPYEIRVPANLSSPASFNSAVLIEPQESFSSEEGEISAVVRYAYQVVTTIGSPTFQLALEEEEGALAKDGSYWRAILINRGKRFAFPDLFFYCFDKSGKKVFEAHQPGAKLPPGSGSPIVVSLESLPPGDYSAFIVARHQKQTLAVHRTAFAKRERCAE